MSIIRTEIVAEEFWESKRPQNKKKSEPSAFEEFEKGMESVKISVNKMERVLLNNLFPSPLWHLDTRELLKSKAMLEELVQEIETVIEPTADAVKKLKKEEHSMIMTEERIEKLKLREYADFTFDPHLENVIVTRRKYT